MKILRINDELHAKIKDLAERDRRTINAMSEILLETGLGAEGILWRKAPTPENTETLHPADAFVEKQIDEYREKKIAEAAPRVDDLFSPPELVPTIVGLDKGISPRSNGLEQPCCLNELQPCKHWVWDTQSGEGYKNVLSGRFMDVE
jgi:hypothetical protein